MAQIMGTQVTPWAGTTIAYRLSAPLLDCYPPWRNVAVNVRPDGERSVFRCLGYELADGTWATIPPAQGSNWRACYSALTPRDLAFAEAEIAAT